MSITHYRLHLFVLLLCHLFCSQPLTASVFSISANFPLLEKNFGAALPTWVITPPLESSLHRFFDTSPISPDNRFIAVITLHLPEVGYPFLKEDFFTRPASVTLYDLQLGSSKQVATTFGWDTQAGAHLQWGATSDELFYNAVEFQEGQSSVFGVALDLPTGYAMRLQCPIYNVGRATMR